MPGISGVLSLAMVGAGGRMEALGAGVPVVVGSLFGLFMGSDGHWDILASLAFRLSSSDSHPQGLA